MRSFAQRLSFRPSQSSRIVERVEKRAVPGLQVIANYHALPLFVGH